MASKTVKRIVDFTFKVKKKKEILNVFERQNMCAAKLPDKTRFEHYISHLRERAREERKKKKFNARWRAGQLIQPGEYIKVRYSTIHGSPLSLSRLRAVFTSRESRAPLYMSHATVCLCHTR